MLFQGLDGQRLFGRPCEADRMSLCRHYGDVLKYKTVSPVHVVLCQGWLPVCCRSCRLRQGLPPSVASRKTVRRVRVILIVGQSQEVSRAGLLRHHPQPWSDWQVTRGLPAHMLRHVRHTCMDASAGSQVLWPSFASAKGMNQDERCRWCLDVQQCGRAEFSRCQRLLSSFVVSSINVQKHFWCWR